jgi:hypothetical protein
LMAPRSDKVYATCIEFRAQEWIREIHVGRRLAAFSGNGDWLVCVMVLLTSGNAKVTKIILI